jgi:hypothetical protein
MGWSKRLVALLAIAAVVYVMWSYITRHRTAGPHT